MKNKQGLMKDQIQKQASENDTACIDVLRESAKNASLGGGFAWIDTQLDMEEEDDDFRPF